MNCMKVTLYMATTVNGYVATKEDDTSWISPEEWSSYASAVKDAGCMIIGHRTYDIITKQPEFSELGNVKIIVLSRSGVKLQSKQHSIAHSPREALDLLQEYQNVIVAGGGAANAAFLTEGLVNEIYLDIEPKLFGKGVKLLNESNVDLDLELVGTKKISQNEIQLHYKVLK